MPPDSPRYGRAFNVKLTPAARDDGWQRFADDHGTDVTALAEVIGLRLAAGARSLRLADIAADARRLSSERRRRTT
jgi:hypothetical protein